MEILDVEEAAERNIADLHELGRTQFTQENYHDAKTTFELILNNIHHNPSHDYIYRIVLANLCATLKRLGNSTEEIQQVKIEYTRLINHREKKIELKVNLTAPKSNGNNKTKTDVKTHGQVLSVNQFDEEKQMATTLLLSQCEEMQLDVTLLDVCHAMQGYGFDQERVMHALLNGHRAPPCVTAKAFDVDGKLGRNTLSVRIPDGIFAGDEFDIEFEDGSTEICRCPDTVPDSSRVISVRYCYQHGSREPITIKPIQEDDNRFMVQIPEEVCEGEEVHIQFKDGTGATFVCPGNLEKNDRKLTLSKPGREDQNDDGRTEVKVFDEDVERKGSISVRVPEGMEEGEEFFVLCSEGRYVMKCPSASRLLETDRVIKTMKPGYSNLPAFKMTGKLEEEFNKNANCIWLHPKNTPPLLGLNFESEKSDDDHQQETKHYIMFQATLKFQERHPELYPKQSRIYNGICKGKESYDTHQMYQMIAYQYAAHGDHGHGKDMIECYDASVTEYQEEMNQYHANNKKPEFLPTIHLERDAWNDPNGASLCQAIMWGRKFGNAPSTRDWSANPYPLCGPAGNICVANLLNQKEKKCTRECIYIQSPFQKTIDINGQSKTIPCHMQQQYRDAYEERVALTKITNEKGKTVKMNCMICSKKTIQRCGGCNMVLFCSSEHQKKSWPMHKVDCKSFKKFKKMEKLT